MSDIFISHDHDDRAVAQKLRDALVERGLDVWWDKDIGTGAQWRKTLTEALDLSKQVIVIWSRHSVHSEWVIAEATRARQAKKLIPVSIDDAEIPMPFGEIQTEPVGEWLGLDDPAPLDVLTRHIKKQLGRLRRQVLVAILLTVAAIAGSAGAYKWANRKTPLELSQEALASVKSESGHTVFLLPFAKQEHAQGYVTDEKIDRAMSTFVQTLNVTTRGLSAHSLDADLEAWGEDYWKLGGFLNALGLVRGEEQERDGDIVLTSDFYIIPAVEQAASPDRLTHVEKYSREEISNPSAFREAKMEQSWGHRTAFALGVLQAQRGLETGDSEALVSARHLLSGLQPRVSDRTRAQQIRRLLDLIDGRPPSTETRQ